MYAIVESNDFTAYKDCLWRFETGTKHSPISEPEVRRWSIDNVSACRVEAQKDS